MLLASLAIAVLPFAAVAAEPDHRILTREQWGANDELLYVDTEHVAPTTNPSESTNDNGTPPVSDSGSPRVTDCEEAQRNYPAEFKTTSRTTKGENGRTLRWAHTYSKKVDLIVVHHTAVGVKGDERSGAERVRAIYQYHANSRGWGDVGYHYLIDEDGEIYEGKAGGDFVVGGHAFCHNVNTVGVALLGNFDVEKPSQDQVKALQWLIVELAEKYEIDLGDNATYHGETYSSPVLDHGDLLSTGCPGYYIDKTMAQIRAHAEDGDVDAAVTFPKKPTSKSSSSRSSSSRSASSRSSRSSSAVSSRTLFKEGISPLGTSTVSGRPGADTPFSVRFTAGSNGAVRGDRIAEVKRSDQRILVWQLIGDAYEPVRGHIVAQTSVPRNATAAIQLKVQLPRERGTFSLTIGDAVFSLQTSGRVTLPGEAASSVRSTRSSASSSRSSISRRPASSRSSSSPSIRIRLESRDSALASCDDANLATLKTLYRGTVTCSVIDGKPALINTVGLEDYLLGLSEEPDTEPYEKQRAFAVAARTYAAHYMGDTYRKFPGKPYDGSDSPAIFQKYTGKSFESKNARWLDAVKDTAHLVLKIDDQIIRPAYFSSDDGRTKAPAEIGWGSFPFAEIFTSKPDPWCEGMENRGHGVGMSGCGAEGQANEGKTAEEILEYYYPGAELTPL